MARILNKPEDKRCLHGVMLDSQCILCANHGPAIRVSPNERQVGGNHYKKREYQHWDFVTDINLPYLPATGAKYVDRWREKNGKEDLEKALHYAEKCMERDVAPPPMSLEAANAITRFCRQLQADDAHIVAAFCHGNYEHAASNIRRLLGS